MLPSFLVSSIVSAALFTGTLGDTTVDFAHDKYKATLKLMSGKCLRTKRVVFVNVKVYEAYVHVSDLTTLKRTPEDILESLNQQKSVAVRLKFLRDVDSDRVIKTYEESFTHNKISLDLPEIKKFLEVMKSIGDVKDDQVMSFFGHRAEDEEILVFETAGKVQVLKGAPGFLKNIYSLWFGHPPDRALEDLKNCLIKG